MADNTATSAKADEKIVSAQEQPKETSKAVEKAPTLEELEKVRDEFASAMFDPPREKREKKEEPPKEEKAVEAKEEKPVESVKEEPKVEQVKEEPPTRRREKAIEAEPEPDSQAILSDIPQEQPEAAEPAKPEPDLALTNGERKRLETLRYLEQTNPAYKGVAARTQAFWKREQEYQDQWKRDNKGQKFNPDDEEHQEFYASNEPAVEEDDFDQARIDMRVEERMRETRKDDPRIEVMRTKLDAIEAKDQLQRAQPTIKQVAAKAATDVIMAVPEFAAVAGEIKDMDKAEAKIEEEHPILYEMVDQEARKAMLIVSEVEKMKALPGRYQVDEQRVIDVGDEKVRPHAEILHTFYSLENFVAGRPPEEQKNGKGQQFIRYADRMELLDAVRKSNLTEAQKKSKRAEIEGRFYTITLQDVSEKIIADSQKKVKTRSEKYFKSQAVRISKESPKLGISPEVELEAPPKINGKPASSAITTASDVVDNTTAAKKSKADPHEEFAAGMFGV